MILSAEDRLADTIRPRLEAAGADVSRVFAIQAVTTSGGDGEFPCLRHVAEIEEAIREHAARLLVIDPLMAYFGGETNSWRDQDVRRALAPVAVMAERTGAAVLIVRHLTKNGGSNAVYRGGGPSGSAARPGAFSSSRRIPTTKSDGFSPPRSPTSAVLRSRWRIGFVRSGMSHGSSSRRAPFS